MTVRNVPSVAFPTIQSAVNASAPGDTVRVAAGTFAESVLIGAGKDRIAILGSGVGRSILQGPGTGTGFTIVGPSHVTIAGFTIRNFPTNGIFVAEDDNVIRNLLVTNSGGAGIRSSAGASRNLFFKIASNNNTGDGILVEGENNYVIASRFENNGDDGLDFDGPNNLVLGNSAAGNDRGLDGGVDRILVIGNRFTANQVGIGLIASVSLLYGNEVSRNLSTGIRLNDSAATVLLENEIEENQGAGILAEGATLNRLLFNEVDENTAQGIDLQGQSDLNVVDDNEIEENGAAGIRLSTLANGNAIRRNELEENNPDIEAPPPANTSNVFDENECQTSIPPGLCNA